MGAPWGRSSSDSVWFAKGCEEGISPSREEYCDEVDVVGVIRCSQLSLSGGGAAAFIAKLDARSMDGDLSEVEEDGDCSSGVYTVLDNSRDSSRALASSSSSWAINSFSRFAASDEESVSVKSASFSSEGGTVSEAMGSGG